MTDSFLPEPVVVKQPKFTRVEGSRHSYAITAHHVEKLKRGSLRPNILLQYLMRPPPQLAAKCDGDQRTSFQSFVSRSGCSGRSNRGKPQACLAGARRSIGVLRLTEKPLASARGVRHGRSKVSPALILPVARWAMSSRLAARKS